MVRRSHGPWRSHGAVPISNLTSPSTALCARQDSRPTRGRPGGRLSGCLPALGSGLFPLHRPLLSASTSLLHDMVQLVSLTAEIGRCTPSCGRDWRTSPRRETTIGARHSSQIAGQGNIGSGVLHGSRALHASSLRGHGESKNFRNPAQDARKKVHRERYWGGRCARTVQFDATAARRTRM